MKTRLISLLIISVVALSCSDDNQSLICGTEDPVKDLPWLAAKIEELKQGSMPHYNWVSKAELGLSTVFIFGNCCPNCGSVFFVYNCTGDHIGNVGDQKVGSDILDRDEIIWKADESLCSF